MSSAGEPRSLAQAAALGGLVLLLINVACLLPLSYFYANSGVSKFFWWLLWLCFLLATAVIIFMYYGAATKACEIPGFIGISVGGSLCMHACFLPVLLAGWWFLANWSKSQFTSIKYDLEPQNLAEIFWGDDPPAAYQFKSGVVQSQPACYLEGFTFECHGYYQEETCEREVCDCLEYDEDGDCLDNDCYLETYECGYYVYPDNCPGVHVITVAPLWEKADDNRAAGQTPLALLYMVETYMYDQGQDAIISDDYEEKCNKPFPLQVCEGNKICGLDLRNSVITPYWTKFGNWWLKYRASQEASGIGRHKPIDLSAKDAQTMANRKMSSDRQTHGMIFRNVPQLWVPAALSKTFTEVDKEVKDSEEAGPTAWLLIQLGTIVPAVLLLYSCCFSLMGGKSPSKVHPKASPAPPEKAPEKPPPQEAMDSDLRPAALNVEEVEQECVLPAGISESVASDYLEALKLEYVDEEEGAVGAFFDNLSPEEVEKLEPYEEEVRGSGEEAIVGLAKKWHLKSPC